VVGSGFLINVCLGTVYAFSLFRKPLEELWGVGATASGLPFMVFLAVFAGGMAVAGRFLDLWGPRRAALVGSVLVGTGWALAGLSPNVGVLTFTYGVMAGAGVGFLYGCPIAMATRWFPDRRGLAVGLTVVGFGASPLLTAPILNALIARVGPLSTFLYAGLAFAVILVALSLPLRFPPAGWVPNGKAGNGQSRPPLAELPPQAMVRRPTFYHLWAAFAIGCLSGLMAIGIAAPFGKEVASLSPSMAAIAVSVFAIFNGVGRPLFGWLTDRLSIRFTAALSFALVLGAAAMLGLWSRGNAPVYFLGFSLLWLNFGGWLAIAPTATAQLFGVKNYGRNYGIVFTAYGAGAILGNVLSGLIRDVTGSYSAVFFPVMALAAVGIVLALVGLRSPAGDGA
jgi:MFS family permease